MRFLGKLSTLGICLVAAFFVRCGEDDGETAGLCGDARLPPVIYDGVASDEAIERVWDKRCLAKEHAGAAALASPEEGSAVPAGKAPMMRWAQEIAAAPQPARPGERRDGGFVLPSLSFGIEEARAHLPPVTGWVYLIEMIPSSGETVWLFTSLESWRPDPVSWRRLSGAETITVRITSAYLNQNVVEDGPWLGPERSFRLEAR